jgi:hypothetical protein
MYFSHLPPLRYPCVGGCWDETQDCYEATTLLWQADALTTRIEFLVCLILNYLIRH